MKKYILGLAVSSLAFISVSCSDFLDTQPEGQPTTTTYFTNDQQAIDAIDILYADVQQEGCFGREFFWEQGAACDVVWGRTRGYNGLATFDYSGDFSPLTSVWTRLTRTQARANWVIERLLEKQEGQSLTSVETRSLGEAYFMRALTHFYIAYRYGTDKQGVPFCRYEDFEGGYDNSIPTQQATVMENYKLIVEDLDKACALLPRFEEYDADNRGRAHKAACVGYKAKTYAYWATWDASQWNNVISSVNELESTYGRDLAESYAQLFSSDFADFWTKEYIWTIPGNGGSNPGGSEFPGVVLENKGWGIYNGWGQNKPSYDIYEEMMKDGAGNDRIVRSILEYGQEFQFNGKTMYFYSTADVESGFMINKYMDPFKHKGLDDGSTDYVSGNGDWPTARVNFPLLRFADCLLLRAEAYLMTGNAKQATVDINRVRTRSHLQPLTADATGADLYHERRCELAFEFSDHLYDIKRWNRSTNAELKALADAELNAHPRVRHYDNRADMNSAFEVGPYLDYQNKNTYQPHMIVFPYPSNEITKAGGMLKQNEGY
ncbi:MAG: RagB/SusD family nutrient uptake outer membrane protein [Muribaculaceae bacterium]